MNEPTEKVLDFSQQSEDREEVMASRKCVHCRARSSYARLGDRFTLSSFEADRVIGFQQCRDPDCLGVVAIIEGLGRDELFPAFNDEPDEGLPEPVETAFAEALRALDEGIWNSCVLMSSRALDEATVDLMAEGEKLYHRIENLAATHRITPELAEWAHTGRLAANLGRHGAEAVGGEKKWNDEVDAKEIVEFARWFFRYVYVLPGQLAARRMRLEQEAKQAGHADEGGQETPQPGLEGQ